MPFLFRLVSCALTEECIAPTGSRVPCNDIFYDHVSPERINAYDECHRYDQSAANLIRLHMLFTDGYYAKLNGNGSIARWKGTLSTATPSPTSESSTSSSGTESPLPDNEGGPRIRIVQAVKAWEQRLSPLKEYFAIRRGNILLRSIALCTRS